MHLYIYTFIELVSTDTGIQRKSASESLGALVCVESAGWAKRWLSMTLNGKVWKPQDGWRKSTALLFSRAPLQVRTPIEISELALRVRGLFPQIELCHACWLWQLLHFARAIHVAWPGYDAPTRPLVFCKLHEADRWGRPGQPYCGVDPRKYFQAFSVMGW